MIAATHHSGLPYPAFVPLTIRIKRYGYRLAHTGLRVWWFIRRPTVSGVKCVLSCGEQVLLVRHTYGSRDWDLPGGSSKRGERPLDTARREIAEELGVTLEHWSDLGSFSGLIENRRDTVHCFHARLARPALTVDRGEIDQVQWFSHDQLPPDLGRYVSRMVALAYPGGIG